MNAVVELSIDTGSHDPLQQTLVAECGLSEQDVAEIGRAQAQEALDFSAAALKLRLVTPQDLERVQRAVMRRQPLGHRLLRHANIPVHAPVRRTQGQDDQMRSLRTELLLRYDRRSRAANVLAVMSPGAGEGRSQTAAELAQSFARTGQSTLLIDADLRHPSQHVRFGQDNNPGLVEAITEERSSQFLQVDDSGLLFLLPSGGPSDAAVELLSSRSFENLLDVWAQRFDHIILDTPPAGDFPDALALGTIARRVLIVNRAQRTSINACREMLRRLEATRAEVLGAVVCHF